MTSALAALTEQRLGELYAAVVETTGDPRPRVEISTRNAGSEARLSFHWTSPSGEPGSFYAAMNADETLACMGDDAAYVKWSTAQLERLRAAVAANGPPAVQTFAQRIKAGMGAFTSMLAKRRLDRALGGDK